MNDSIRFETIVGNKDSKNSEPRKSGEKSIRYLALNNFSKKEVLLQKGQLSIGK